MSAAPPLARIAAAEAAEPQARRAASDRMRTLYLQTPATLGGYAFGLGVVLMSFHGLAGPRRLFGWAAVVSLLWVLQLLHYLRWRRRRDADEAMQRAWRRSWGALLLAHGALWGAAAWLFWGLGGSYQTTSLVLVLYGLCVASVQMLATQTRLFLAYNGLVLAPTVLRIASDAGLDGRLQLAAVVASLFVVSVLMARTYGNALGQAMLLKRHTDEVAAQLRAGKAEADAARRAAEAACQAKTQFFAAASHDLRQPLHAMGLFAEALRQRVHEPEVAALVNSINESVDALEGLFGELLDITRIDSGDVEPRPEAMAMRELFARLRLHFEPLAFEKGLALAFRGERHVAHADPVLVERILRNLVSNAIRYTDDGGVLVSCRPRGGRLVLQVWDSGIGIADVSLPYIFEEFFQVRSTRPLQPHHRKGLGLGLAIVQRLAALMQAELTVRSRVGHGTVFSLLLPRGRLPPPAPGPDAALSLPALALAGRRIVVVDDEAAVREGLVVLLQAWGAQVLDFDCLDALQGWLGSPQADRPDLLITDDRLPQGCSGLQALQAARARWPDAALPAIVVTAGSFDGHERGAAEHGYHLLIKPVLPNRLRAMIAFKLGMR